MLRERHRVCEPSRPLRLRDTPEEELPQRSYVVPMLNLCSARNAPELSPRGTAPVSIHGRARRELGHLDLPLSDMAHATAHPCAKTVTSSADILRLTLRKTQTEDIRESEKAEYYICDRIEWHEAHARHRAEVEFRVRGWLPRQRSTPGDVSRILHRHSSQDLIDI